jgi:hypothetical protein
MNLRHLLYYEFRIVFGLASLLPALLLPAYLLLGLLTWVSREATPTLFDALRAFVLILPLSAGLLAAHLMTVEREEDFDELRRTYPEPTVWLPLVRTFGALLVGSISALASHLLLNITGSFALSDTLLPAIAPSLMLLGIGLLLDNTTGSYALTAAVVIGYWFIELQTRGSVTGVLFLFQAAMPQPNVSTKLNQGLLAGIGVVLLVANALYSAWRRRGCG